MNWGKLFGTIGAVAGVPFTGGASLLIPSLIGAGASVAGGLLANKGKSATTPTMDPAYSPLQQQLLQMVRQRLQTSPDLGGYTAAGQGNINRSFDAVKQAQSNDLTARGLGTSPVAGNVDALRENARAGQSAQFLNTIPLLRRQMQAEDLGLGQNLLGLGRGTSTTTSTGGGLGGGAESLAQYMGYLMGKGAFKKPGAMPTGPYAGNPQTSIFQ